MKLMSQTLAATVIGLRGLPHRAGNSLVIIVGIAGVVAVLISVLALSAGFEKTIQGAARADRVLVLTRGVDSESSSSLSRANVAAIEAAPGLQRNGAGQTVLSAEVLLVAPVARKASGTDAYITLRGVGPRFGEVRPEIKLVAGRMFEPGLHEIIVGRAARAQFADLEIGNSIRLHDGDWSIVGTFEGGDNVRESELLADAQTVMSSYQLDAFNSVTALLVDAHSLADLRDALNIEPSLTVGAVPEPDYLASVSSAMHRRLKLVAYVIGGIMALGALFGALNTMYSAVSARMVELATLRSIGFRSRTLIIATLAESLLLALAGALVGIGIGYLAFDGRAISTLGGSRWDSQLVYSLSITPTIVATATVLACAIGLVGGVLPALRAARTSAAAALREA